MTVLDPALVTGDAERVTGERQERPDPEVPERARRRTFTAACKQEVLAAYEVAPDGEKGAILRREGLYSSLITSGGGPATPGAAGLSSHGGARQPSRGTPRLRGCRRRRPSWSRSWLRPASRWMCRENCTRSVYHERCGGLPSR